MHLWDIYMDLAVEFVCKGEGYRIKWKEGSS